MHNDDTNAPLESTPLTHPTVHLNGSGRRILLEQLTSAATAIEHAIESLRRAAPLGRDYYPQGPEAWPAARREHLLRLGKLRALQGELDELRRGLDGRRYTSEPDP
jgi:hypothetical protein